MQVRELEREREEARLREQARVQVEKGLTEKMSAYEHEQKIREEVLQQMQQQMVPIQENSTSVVNNTSQYTLEPLQSDRQQRTPNTSEVLSLIRHANEAADTAAAKVAQHKTQQQQQQQLVGLRKQLS